MPSYIRCLNIGSPFDFGWKKEGAVLTPILYERLTTSEVTSDLTCICKGKDHCVVACACFQNGLPCTELCTCAAEKYGNTITNMITMQKNNNNIKIKRLCVQTKGLTGFPMNL